MTKSEIQAYNAGVDAVVQIAAASAHAMQAKLVQRPTRYSFAVEALNALAEAGADLVLPVPAVDHTIPT